MTDHESYTVDSMLNGGLVKPVNWLKYTAAVAVLTTESVNALYALMSVLKDTTSFYLLGNCSDSCTKHSTLGTGQSSLDGLLARHES